MSDLAEYARALHETQSIDYVRQFEAISFPSGVEKLSDIRAVICDVYGTLLNYWRPGFDKAENRNAALLKAFREISDQFEMNLVLAEINPEDAPEKTLSDFYHGLIALSHEKAIKKGVTFPEVQIESVWSLIVAMLRRRGYDPLAHSPGSADDFPRYLAYTYNFRALGRQLYPGVVDALQKLKQSNIVLGILSNAQFYTPMDLTLLIRDQSGGQIEDYTELFDPDLTFYSFEYGVAKPNQILFRRLYDALYEYQILPSQTVFIGNDLGMDIQPAQEAGMKTAFFTGDVESAFIHDLSGVVTPDISFQDWSELPDRISFYQEGLQENERDQ